MLGRKRALVYTEESIIRHELTDFAFIESHLVLRDFQPYANPSEAEDETGKATPEPDPNNGQNREAPGLDGRKRVAVEILVPQEGGSVEAGQSAGPVGQRRRYGSGKPVIRDIKGGEPDEEAQLLGNGTSEKVIMEVNDVEVGAHCELWRDLALELVRREVEDGEVDEGLDVGRDGSGEGVGGEVE
ncbi:hypothetical protein S83_014820 [Arachis hypogaea]